MKTNPLDPLPPRDEIIEICAAPDRELQCIDAIRQVIELFFPLSDPGCVISRRRILSYCEQRFCQTNATFFPGGPIGEGGEESIFPPGFAEKLGREIKKVEDERNKSFPSDDDPK